MEEWLRRRARSLLRDLVGRIGGGGSALSIDPRCCLPRALSASVLLSLLSIVADLAELDVDVDGSEVVIVIPHREFGLPVFFILCNSFYQSIPFGAPAIALLLAAAASRPNSERERQGEE